MYLPRILPRVIFVNSHKHFSFLLMSFIRQSNQSVHSSKIWSRNRVLPNPGLKISRMMATATPFSAHSRLRDGKPAFTYGTAWKKDETKRMVKEALQQGFRRIDTAAQPKHYQEHLVGEALREAYAEGTVKRNEVHVQTKYTTPAGQDLSNMPYDPKASLEEQVRTSVASSLKNLRSTQDNETDSYIDCLLLHSPLPTIEQTLQAWNLLETYVPHQIKALGISNVDLHVLREIYNVSTIKPSVVQNRFYPATRFDDPLRAFCRDNGIVYQSFWTLTGNPKLARSEVVADLAVAVGVSTSVALYALVMDQGIEVLNGTTSPRHMQEDFEGVGQVLDWAEKHPRQWVDTSTAFLDMIKGRTI